MNIFETFMNGATVYDVTPDYLLPVSRITQLRNINSKQKYSDETLIVDYMQFSLQKTCNLQMKSLVHW